MVRNRRSLPVRLGVVPRLVEVAGLVFSSRLLLRMPDRRKLGLRHSVQDEESLDYEASVLAGRQLARRQDDLRPPILLLCLGLLRVWCRTPRPNRILW